MLATFAQWMPPGVARAADLPAGEADRSQPWQVTSYGNEAGLSQQRAFDIAFTPDGTVWTACSDGLRRFDGYEWSRFDTNDGLPSSFVRALCVDNLGRLWVAPIRARAFGICERHIYDPLGSQSGMANANVREIDQDPDGTLWFSCDQWPQTTGKPGGLTSLTPGTPGRWTTYYMSNGVPMDNVIGYFRDSGGRQFVLTPNAWGQRRAGQWGVPADPGYQAEDRVLQMAEAKDGTLFAQGEYTLLTLANGRWQDHPGSRTRLLCATRTGQMARRGMQFRPRPVLVQPLERHSVRPRFRSGFLPDGDGRAVLSFAPGTGWIALVRRLRHLGPLGDRRPKMDVFSPTPPACRDGHSGPRLVCG